MHCSNGQYLVVLTKKYGENFTGATLATQKFVARWSSLFNKIFVLTLEQGKCELISNVEIKKYKTEYDVYKELKSMKRKMPNKIVGYSDDHLGYILSKAGIRYIHTYHGNWPDARWSNFSFFLKSFYFMHLYGKTLKKADIVANVSEYMEAYTKRYNLNSIIIHNGIDSKQTGVYKKELKTFIMVGNLDSRKYKQAIVLADALATIDRQLSIDIYGRVIDEKIACELRRRSNIRLKGQCTEIPYGAYEGLINTSTIENLSLAVCEAIKMGIPVFCFNVGGLPEVVIERKSGFVFPKNHVKEMAEAIEHYSKSEVKMAVDRTVVNSFDWDYAAKKYMALFKTILGREVK